MTQRRKRGRNPTSEDDIIQYIATKTGLPSALVNRVVEGGEPWPHVAALGQRAESLGVPLGELLTSEDDLLDGGLDALEIDAEAVTRHRQQVATTLELDEAIVASISDAMQQFFRQRFTDLRREKRDRLRRKHRRQTE